MELRSLIQQELETNPVLEEPEEPTQDNQEDEWDREVEELRRQEEDWRDYFSQQTSRSGPGADAQERRQFLFDSQVRQESLSDHLIGQLILLNLTEEEVRVGEAIIGNLDDAGYLAVPLEEIAATSGVPIETAHRVLGIIQDFHPPGVAARSLQETLLIQLRLRGREDDLEGQLVRNSLNELGRKRYLELARKHSVSVERIQEAAAYIATLQPRPGSAFAPDLPQNVVQPEAALVKSNGVWTVQMNHDPVPRLRINDTYKDLLGQSARDQNLRDYLKNKIRSGKFLIKCLHQRQETIENILKEVVKQQVDFLENGVSHLKPLTMNQVAQVVGVHETTVSRAIAGKYVQTPWGVLPIKFFFTSGYQTSGGETLANTSIKDAIADLVSREDRKAPLSDSDIVKILSERGIDLARRTVAKYRAELKILPSNLRREL